jgi:tetratricopeptide (TPR) repeat protein
MPVPPPKVFISYSHDSAEHEERVLALAERLRKEGVDAQIDQYIAGTPPDGWPRWMLDKLDWAEFVLVVCTETYYRRFRGREEPGKGKGADWEGNLITLEMYDVKSKTTKFVPVFFASQDEQFIPEPVRGHTHYLLDSEDNYAKLYGFLTGQAGVRPSELGSLTTLARKQVEPLRFVIHNLPFRPNPVFTGRDADMERLRKLLENHGDGELTQIVVLHGLGGVGKTQLAVEYAWKHLGGHEAVLWVMADSPETFKANLAARAQTLRLPEAGAKEQSVQMDAVLGWLKGHERWLIIADNADTDEAVRAVCDGLSPNVGGHVLITSRLARWPVNVPHLPLDVLSREDAVCYLVDRVASEGHNAGDETAARALSDELGHLPLALEQAAAFVIEVRWTFDKYCERFRDARPELLSEHREGATRYPESVAKTWSITLDRLSPLARAILRVAAWFAPDAIPRAIFSADHSAFLEALGEQVNVSDLAIDKALGELDRFSLVRLTVETVSVHRLLQAVEQDSLSEAERNRWLVCAAQLCNAMTKTKGQPDDARTWRLWLPLSPHAETLIEHTIRYRVESIAVALLANEFGLFAKTRGQYAKAEPLYQWALAIWRKILGPNHPDVGTNLHNLAALYEARGEYAKAEPLYQQALAIREKALGPEHPDVAQSLNKLGELHQTQGQYAKAEPLYQQALAIREKALGPEHPYVATSLNSLALLCSDQGRYADAELLHARALAIRQKTLGSEHPDVANSLHNLAILYGARGQYAKAKPLYRRAIAIREKALGPEHPNVANSLNGLGSLYSNQGQYSQAKPLLERALAIRQKTLGPEHPNVANSLHNLAWLYNAQGQYATAERLYRRALEIREKTLGPEHPNVAESLDDLASLYQAQGQYAKAQPLSNRALEIRQRRSVRSTPTSHRASTDWRSYIEL